MTTRFVPTFPPDYTVANADQNANLVRAALPVRGTAQWQSFGEAVNWLHGRGGALVGANPFSLAFAPGSNNIFRYWIYPRAVQWAYAVVVTLRAVDSLPAIGTVTVDVPVASSEVFQWLLDGADDTPKTFLFVYDRDVRALSGPEELTVTVDNDPISDGQMVVDGIGVYEIPRTILEQPGIFHDDGSELTTVIPGEAIYQDFTPQADRSIEAVARHARDTEEGRKNHLFSWFSPVPVTFQSATFADLFSLEPHILARRIRETDTNRDVAWNCFGWVDGGSAEVRLTTTHGSDVITIVTPAFPGAWQAQGTITVDVEEAARWPIDGGIPGGVRNTVAIEARKLADGGANLFLFGLTIGEID